MSNLSMVRSKAQLIGTLNPKAWDALKPKQNFPFGDATIELFVTDTVKQASALIAEKKYAKEVLMVSKKMAESATRSMLVGWKPGDDIYPPWPWPFPWPVPTPWPVHGPWPGTYPWKKIELAEQLEVAHILTHLSGLTVNQEFNVALKDIAAGMVRSIASKLVDDFERCGTIPRPPIPRRQIG